MYIHTITLFVIFKVNVKAKWGEGGPGRRWGGHNETGTKLESVTETETESKRECPTDTVTAQQIN